MVIVEDLMEIFPGGQPDIEELRGPLRRACSKSGFPETAGTAVDWDAGTPGAMEVFSVSFCNAVGHVGVAKGKVLEVFGEPRLPPVKMFFPL
jgi:hypothetical protein